jgi:hypothetical protein
MMKETLVSILVLVALVGLSSSALGQETQNKSIESAEVSNLTENIMGTAPAQGSPSSSLIDLGQSLPADLKVPIAIQNNSTKTVWTSPGDRPAFVFAGLTNTGDLGLDVYTISIDPDTKERSAPQFAGTAFPQNDGVIIFGKFIAIEVKCENSTTFETGIGSLETVNYLP